MNSLPPGVTDAMIENEVLDEEWEKLLDWLLGSGLTPDEIRAAISVARAAWEEWDDIHSDRDAIPAESWQDIASRIFADPEDMS